MGGQGWHSKQETVRTVVLPSFLVFCGSWVQVGSLPRPPVWASITGGNDILFPISSFFLTVIRVALYVHVHSRGGLQCFKQCGIVCIITGKVSGKQSYFYEILLPKKSACVQCIVRPNKQKCQTVEQRQDNFRAMHGEWMTHAPQNLNSLKIFSKASLWLIKKAREFQKNHLFLLY